MKYVCNYCDHKFDLSQYHTTKPRCPKCKDTNLKRIKADFTKIDYYGESNKEAAQTVQNLIDEWEML